MNKFLLIFLLIPSIAFAGTLSLTWDKPTTNTDGTILTDIAGYKIYYGSSTKNYTQTVDVGNVLTKDLTVVPGTYYAVVTVYNSFEVESNFSNEAVKIVSGLLAELQAIKTEINLLAKTERGLRNSWEVLRVKIKTLEVNETDLIIKNKLKILRFQTSAIKASIANIVSYRNVLNLLIINIINK